MMLSSMLSTLGQFNMDNMCLLRDMGYTVTAVANMGEDNPVSPERLADMKERMAAEGICLEDVAIPRKITDMKGILAAYKKVKKLCDDNAYEIVHCHSPIGSVIARLGARGARKKYGTRVIYTAHGFHFFRRAPLLNWLLYFPVEWVCAHFTDTLITINREDYARAKKYMHAKKIEYIPGVGIDTEKLFSVEIDKSEKRKEMGLSEDEIAVLSVGELNDNKNHETILRAIGMLEDKPTYVICGTGDKAETLSSLAKSLGVRLLLLGYRTDVQEICRACDIFAFPSKREGLSVSLMEAMAAGLPCLVSSIRGNTDLIKDGEGGFLCDTMQAAAFSEKLKLLCLNEALRSSCGQENRKNAGKYDKKVISEKMQSIYN